MCVILSKPDSVEQNRTVSLLISGHIHDIEIQCEQQNVIYTGLGIFSLQNTKLLYRYGTLGCSHSLVSVVLIVERGGGGGGGGGGGSTTIFSMLFSQQCFKFMYY